MKQSYILKQSQKVIDACNEAMRIIEDVHQKEINKLIEENRIGKRWFGKYYTRTDKEALEHASKGQLISDKEFINISRNRKLEHFDNLKKLAMSSNGQVWLSDDDNSLLFEYFEK